MKKILSQLIALFMVLNLFAQKEKFDIATYTPPTGWQRLDSNGIRFFMDQKIKNGLTSFCQIFIYPSHASSGNSAEDFQSEWNNRVVKATGSAQKPVTQVEKTPDGWEVVTGNANIQHMGITFTCILVTATGFGKEMTVQVNLAGQDYMSSVQKFLTDFDLDSKADVTTSNSSNNAGSGNGSINDYVFTAPEQWQTMNNGNLIQLSQTGGSDGCLVIIYPPQSSSGNLENDARNIFNQFYSGWEYQDAGDKKEDVSKGYNLQGLEYCMIEASMKKKRPDGYYYDLEDGQLVVIKNRNQNTLILGRHNRAEFPCFCKYRYDYWNRFFNSFTIKGTPSQKVNEDVGKRIVGSWESIGSSGSNALMKYIFAANGRYQFVGAYSTTSIISPTMVELKTSGFKGDGAYHLNSNKLTLIKDRANPETVGIRFEKINHGGSGWKDRLYILDNSGEGGKPNQVCFEKESK